MWLNAKRVYVALSCAIVAAIIVLGVCVYFANQLLMERSKDVHDARLKTLVLEEAQNGLRKAKADIEKYRGLAEVAKAIVPQDKDQAQTVREIANLAAANDIKLGAITFPTSSLGESKAVDSQLKPVPTIKGTYALNIIVRSDAKVSASFDNLLGFLDDLENNRRTALVTGISLTPDVLKPGKVQFSLTINEYIKP